MTVHQCLNGRAPPYLLEHCIPVSSAHMWRHLRSTNRHLLAIPCFRLHAYDRRAFSVAVPISWNSLPDFIRDSTGSTDCFRRLLKRTCSCDTSASSALGVLNDNMLYKFTYNTYGCQAFSVAGPMAWNSRILSGILRAAQTVLGICLKRISSCDTSE